MALKRIVERGFKSVTPKHDLLYTNYTDMKFFKAKAVPTRMQRLLIAIKKLVFFCVCKQERVWGYGYYLNKRHAIKIEEFSFSEYV